MENVATKSENYDVKMENVAKNLQNSDGSNIHASPDGAIMGW